MRKARQGSNKTADNLKAIHGVKHAPSVEHILFKHIGDKKHTYAGL